MEVNGQHQAPVDLLSWKNPDTKFIVAGWAPEQA